MDGAVCGIANDKNEVGPVRLAKNGRSFVYLKGTLESNTDIISFAHEIAKVYPSPDNGEPLRVLARFDPEEGKSVFSFRAFEPIPIGSGKGTNGETAYKSRQGASVSQDTRRVEIRAAKTLYWCAVDAFFFRLASVLFSKPLLS